MDNRWKRPIGKKGRNGTQKGWVGNEWTEGRGGGDKELNDNNRGSIKKSMQGGTQ